MRSVENANVENAKGRKCGVYRREGMTIIFRIDL